MSRVTVRPGGASPITVTLFVATAWPSAGLWIVKPTIGADGGTGPLLAPAMPPLPTGPPGPGIGDDARLRTHEQAEGDQSRRDDDGAKHDRRSVRSTFEGRPIPIALENVIDGAVAAPSGSGREPPMSSMLKPQFGQYG